MGRSAALDPWSSGAAACHSGDVWRVPGRALARRGCIAMDMWGRTVQDDVLSSDRGIDRHPVSAGSIIRTSPEEGRHMHTSNLAAQIKTKQAPRSTQRPAPSKPLTPAATKFSTHVASPATKRSATAR